ncbi:uncharacterized protein LOC111251506 [Varroa destructor]|uniref:Uncharacterized protein n=1 Tax=Varroa destructor TaxID=109461 RepID=A0A7M7KA15_VARDE|nr:uncharacterized protein LOC111251506 [Varroa destructor]
MMETASQEATTTAASSQATTITSTTTASTIMQQSQLEQKDKPDEENVGKECLLSKVIKSILSTTEETPFYKEGDSEAEPEDEVLLQQGAALEQAILESDENTTEEAQGQEEGATTTATVTAVIGEGEAAVALALSPDANGQMVKQIVLADGHVLGTCTSSGELSLGEGVQLLQQEDGQALLQSAHSNIQVPLDTVRVLLHMEQQSIQEG